MGLDEEHATLVAELRLAGDELSREPRNDSYGTSGHPYYFVRVPVRRAIARSWLAGHPDATAEDVLAVVERLIHGESHEEKTLAPMLLAGHAGARRLAGPLRVERWLDSLGGWAEIDTLCAGVFTERDVLRDWTDWQALVRRLARDPAVDKRRASMVLLTGPVMRSPDPRLAALATETVDALKGERDARITKAVSWLLRSLVALHADEIRAYLAANEQRLPHIAVRETRSKLATGRKSPA